jgi:hypothetical protein
VAVGSEVVRPARLTTTGAVCFIAGILPESTGTRRGYDGLLDFMTAPTARCASSGSK